jgi:D-aminoacyl-tRNA deacylase
MRLVIQRVSEASVKIDSNAVASINKGLLVLVGVGQEDSEEDIDWLLNKLLNMRIFIDEEGKMNCSILDVKGQLLSVSQFTLFAKTKKGNRPSFINSAQPEIAKIMFESWCEKASKLIDHQSGIFAADMQVSLINDGPVTITIDSKNRE